MFRYLSAFLVVGLMASTASGQDILWTTGADAGPTPDSGLDFPGGGGPLTFVDVTGLDVNTHLTDSSYTMSLWINADVGSDGFYLGQTSQGIHHGIRNGGFLHTAHWGSDFNAATVVPLDQWVHVTYTYEYAGPRDTALGAATIYMDGVNDNPGGLPFQQNAPNGSGNFIIGARTNGETAFNGQIDDVAIWPQVLPLADIEALAAGGSPNAASAAPLAYWNFEEGAGLTVGDTSSNGFHGTINEPPPPATYNFSAAQDLQGWTVLHGAANFTTGDGGGMGPADADGGRAHDNAHETFLVQSPEVRFVPMQPSDLAMYWETAGGAGDQEGNGPDFNNPDEVVAFNGGQSDDSGEKGLAFLNVDTGQYDAVLFNQGDGGTDLYELTADDLTAAGVDLSQTYRLQYYENDEGGWGWGQLNTVYLNLVPEPSSLLLLGLALAGLAALRRNR